MPKHPSEVDCDLCNGDGCDEDGEECQKCQGWGYFEPNEQAGLNGEDND